MRNRVLNFLLLWVLSVYVVSAQDNVITFYIGTGSVTLLSEGQRKGGTNVLVGATDEMIKKAIPDGAYPSATNVFLVVTEKYTALIDAGLGRKTVENLELSGKKASDIDAIFITHFHGDHIGSLLLNNEKVYPKATLFISKPEYDYYMNDAMMNTLPENRRGAFTTARNIFKAYTLEIFNPGEIDNAKELLPGLRGVAAFGHTPGHVGFMFDSEDANLFFWGDLTHAMAIQMPYPEVAMTYDTDTAKAIACRLKLLTFLSNNNIRVAGAHIEYPGIGYIKKNALSGYDFKLLCSCEGKLP